MILYELKIQEKTKQEPDIISFDLETILGECRTQLLADPYIPLFLSGREASERELEVKKFMDGRNASSPEEPKES